jgi:hypothetical protein
MKQHMVQWKFVRMAIYVFETLASGETVKTPIISTCVLSVYNYNRIRQPTYWIVSKEADLQIDLQSYSLINTGAVDTSE